MSYANVNRIYINYKLFRTFYISFFIGDYNDAIFFSSHDVRLVKLEMVSRFYEIIFNLPRVCDI